MTGIVLGTVDIQEKQIRCYFLPCWLVDILLIHLSGKWNMRFPIALLGTGNTAVSKQHRQKELMAT